MTREENIKAILEYNFAGFKRQIIDDAVKRICELKQGPQEECVSLKSMWNVIHACEAHNCPPWIWREMLAELPTIQIESVPETAQWEKVVTEYDKDGSPGVWHYECSKCRNMHSGFGEFRYCPNCGCKMTGGRIQ